ncbi:MAG: FAD binding domain-containing protein [Acidimicrobiia bacterium]
MFPANFDYVAPTSLDEALAILAERGEDAKVLAGGQSLIPLMKLRFAAPALIVDINRIPGLDDLTVDGSNQLHIGALVRTSAMERSDLLRKKYPTMAAAAPQISDPIVRNQGTFVGSLCHADPQGDWGSVMLAMGGAVVARSATSQRSIPITEFFDGPFTSVLRADELAVEATVPDPGKRSFGTYLKLERKVGDFATVGVAVFISTERGIVRRAGIALTGVGATNIKALDAEEALLGKRLSDKTIAQAAQLAAAASDPKTDVRGTAEYKRDVVRVFVARGLGEALGAKAA